jgi:hypothetical protein
VEAHRLKILFGLSGLKAAELHGNLTQAMRLDALESFRKQEVDYLIATDVAARVSDSFQQHHLLTLRSGVAEYVIFFTTLYDIIFL